MTVSINKIQAHFVRRAPMFLEATTSNPYRRAACGNMEGYFQDELLSLTQVKDGKATLVGSNWSSDCQFKVDLRTGKLIDAKPDDGEYVDLGVAYAAQDFVKTVRGIH